MNIHRFILSRNVQKLICKSSTIGIRASSSGIAHTLNVKNQIEERRKRAVLGGGHKRIEAQHKKVRTNFCFS